VVETWRQPASARGASAPEHGLLFFASRGYRRDTETLVMTARDRPPLRRSPPRPDRVRSTVGGFAYLPNRFLHDGSFASLTHAKRSLYLFLVLAANRNGVSYYGHDRIASALELPLDDFLELRNRLIEKDLVVDHRAPLTQTDDFELHDPATVRAIIRSCTPLRTPHGRRPSNSASRQSASRERSRRTRR
jgi:hypothetical protein